jgi:hypothetical protein
MLGVDADRLLPDNGLPTKDRSMMRIGMRSTALCGLLVIAGFGLSACDESEQGRIVRLEKGTYLGEPDTPLSEETRQELRMRTRLQAGGSI